MSKPHKHAELIKVWADGAEIEIYNDMVNAWTYIPTPTWYKNKEYRIKPKVKWEATFIMQKEYVNTFEPAIPVPKKVHDYDMLCQFVQEHETDWDNQYCEVFKDFNQNYKVIGCDTYPSLGTIRMSEQCAEQLCDMLNNKEIEL